ncbi:MAG: phosphatidate cytidylyltransferase [Ferruginibacter sp.]
MALQIQTFKTRAITAIVFAVVMLAGILLNAWTFIILFLAIMVGCVYEFVKIIKLINGEKYIYYLPLFLLYIVMPVWMMIDLGTRLNNYAAPGNDNLLYSPILPLAIIFSIWINDTMAYIVGSFIGKTPFSKISPKKTWEGTIGGAILCVLTISLLGYFLPIIKYIPVQHWTAIAAICAVFGTLGDLLESKLKRTAGIKDSGSFMPGHGGFLDRFDSLLIATPFAWMYVVLFMHA